jgi:hypothetical protein
MSIRPHGLLVPIVVSRGIMCVAIKMPHRTLKVVLVSPSDVKDERKTVRGAVDDINEMLRTTAEVRIDLIRWEDARPGMHESGPQGRVDEHLCIEECDAVIAIFWKRFGTQLAGTADSGTAHEIGAAMESWKNT